ncbi:MAG: ABC transporter permease [Armatimonadota bacterium]|nr:ABC transporter permease [Armatimonadota bacterium]MDR7402688.1 ABC transporter permease [Armatimonadota bacterium]MDR7437762.1 ABC transporter permease [Armatimonadota bacterium]MDR7473275.1 ABC transporter permease [Armatimonadota bacterium]MDR7506516.1 ABC transporter permease [Armatimonadota bacterium]
MVAAIVKVALRAIRANALRSALTALGVIIGVAAVVAMLALGTGARAAVARQVQALGSNLLVVFPGSVGLGGVQLGLGAGQTLTWEDALAVREQVPQVEDVTAEFGRTAQVVAASANTATQVIGVTPSYQEVRNHYVVRGAFFTDEDMRTRARVAVLGPAVVETLFGSADADPVGSRIRINRVPFTVIGVLEAKGAAPGPGGSRDDVVLVPLSTAQKRLFGVTNVRQIYIKVRSADQMSAAQARVEEVLRARHRLRPGEDNDFRIFNQADILGALEGVSRTMTLLLGGIAAVSLLVGGIGIMNIMLVSVTERTREIGLRKAVGATRADILLQFLVEAVLLAAGGGVAGLALGVAGARMLTRAFGWATVLAPGGVLLALAFAVAVGVFFGYYPARRAAALDPIVALRYE